MSTLRFEELEERIAPTLVDAENPLHFTDQDNDSITVTYEGPDGSSVDVLDTEGNAVDDGDDIGYIHFTNANLSSFLNVYGQNEDDTIVIEHEITAAGSQDVGEIIIGYGPTGPAGTVIFGDNFSVDIAGTLGTFVANGDIDCDQKGQWIRAGEDIGFIELDELTLNPTLGFAVIAAGYNSAYGEIHFIVVDDIWNSTGGSAMAPTAIPAGGITIADDIGDGTAGFINLKLSGPSAVGYCYPIPVWGGGNVLADVVVESADTALAITTSGRGGEVSYISFEAATPGVTVSGAADTDVFFVWGQDYIDQVVNKTIGGDIGGVWSEAGDHIGLIQTGKLGVLGSIYSGTGNSVPVVSLTPEAGYTTHTYGWIGTVKVGEIVGTSVDAWYIVNLSTTGGGILDSEIRGVTGIGSVSSKGAIVESGIYAIDSQTVDFGGSIGTISAPMMVASKVVALGSITKFTVARGIYDTDISTYIDDGAGGYVGGGIGSFAVGGMGDGSSVETNDGIDSVKIGAAGMDQSMVYSHKGITSVQVAGDVVDSLISADQGFGAVKVGGDVIHESMITGHEAGSISVAGNLSYGAIELGHGTSGSIQIGGSVVGDTEGIYVYGDIGSIAVKGYVFGTGTDIIAVEGNVNSVSINGPVHYANLHFNSAGTVKIAKSMMDSNVIGESSLGSISVGGSMYGSAIVSNGDMGAVSVKGSVLHSHVGATGNIVSLTMNDVWDSGFEANGNFGLVTIKAGDLDHNTEVFAGGDFAGMKVKGVIAGQVNVTGNLTGSILSGGNDAVEYGGAYYFTDANGQITGGALDVTGSITPGVVIS